MVFIEAPDYEVLKAMNKSAKEAGVMTKQLTVSPRLDSCITATLLVLLLLADIVVRHMVKCRTGMFIMH